MSAVVLRRPSVSGGGWLGFVDRILDASGAIYRRALEATLRRRVLASLVFVILCVLTGWLYARVPGGFLPTEDQGYFNIEVALPEGASISRTEKVMRRLEGLVVEHPAVSHVFTRVGSSPRYGTDESKGNLFVALKSWGDRDRAEWTAPALVAGAKSRSANVPEAKVAVLQPAEIPGFGENSGFEFQLMDPSGTNSQGLMESAQQLVRTGARKIRESLTWA